MIIDLERFTAAEKPFWDELERLLKRVEDDPACRLGVDGAVRFHYLYQRASAVWPGLTVWQPRLSSAAIWRVWLPGPMVKFTPPVIMPIASSRVSG